MRWDGVVAGALEFREMGSPYGQPSWQPTGIYPAKLLPVASGATAVEPSVRVQGSPDSRVVRL